MWLRRRCRDVIAIRLMGNDARRKLQSRIMEQLRYSILSDSHVTFLQGEGSEQRVLGSGTLISIGGATAILTADHVLAELRDPIHVLFPSRLDDFPGSTPGLPRTLQYCEKKTIGRGRDEARGPDLGLLTVPKCDVPHAKAFYSLTKNANCALTEPRPNDEGGWALVGAPAAWTGVGEPHPGFSSIKEQRVLIGATDVQREFERDGFDYFDILTNSSAVPTSFGGCSGGGLWHVRFEKTASGKVEVHDPILSGVAFYECGSPPHAIRCHGRRSVYQKVIGAFQR